MRATPKPGGIRRPGLARQGVERRALLTAIRAFHSAVFLVMLFAIAWLVGTGVAGRRDRSVAVAGALVAIESLVFVANGGVCPLTPLAERYGARRGGVSDIFLPDALARTIPLWATPLVVLGFRPTPARPTPSAVRITARLADRQSARD